MIVLLFLTAPIQYMPQAVLASVVFLIGIELIDLAGMGKILHLRVDEFVVATLLESVRFAVPGDLRRLSGVCEGATKSPLCQFMHVHACELGTRWPMKRLRG
jgi:hypothetical protein